jgi:hypothetical protein
VVVVVVLVGYPLSYGPINWLNVRLEYPGWLDTPVDIVYAPLFWLMREGPDWIRIPFRTYCDWWTGPLA